MTTRFPFNREKVALLAAAVDPRYLQLNFLTPKQRVEVQCELKGRVEALSQNDLPSTIPSLEEPPPKKKTAMSFPLGTDGCQNHSTWEDEIEQFLKQTQLDPDADTLVWWRANHKRFPTIVKLARRFLSIPATSVPSERIFSTAGLIITSLRSSLTVENVDMSIFLNRNL